MNDDRASLQYTAHLHPAGNTATRAGPHDLPFDRLPPEPVARDAEHRIQRQAEVLQTIFDHIPVMIAFTDESGRASVTNRHFEQVTGWSQSEAQESDLIAALYPDPAVSGRVYEFIRNPPADWEEFPLRTKDGRTVETLWANVLLEDGTSIGIGKDITGRKRAEAERARLHSEVVASRAELQVLSRRLIEAQEAERAHLARELHDEIGQVLTTVNLSLAAVRAQVDPATRERLDDSLRVVDRAIEQVRSLSLDLRPASLDILGLEAALRAYLARQGRQAGLAFEFFCNVGADRLPPTLETVCFRVVQEATTNVLRHARADLCVVELNLTDEAVGVSVRDDGVGFDTNAVHERMLRGEGFGLAGMTERAHLFGGSIEIDSAPGKGTEIRIRFPVPVV